MSLRRHLTSAPSSKLWKSSRTPDSGPPAIYLIPSHVRSIWPKWPQMPSTPTAISPNSTTHTSMIQWNRRVLAQKSGDHRYATVDPWIRSNIPRHTTSTYGHIKSRISNNNNSSSSAHYPQPFTCFQCRTQINRNRVVSRHPAQPKDVFEDHRLSKPALRLVRVRLYSSTTSSSLPSKTPAAHPSPPRLDQPPPLTTRTKMPISHVEQVRRKLEHHLRARDPDSLYKQFWRICQEETVEDQKQIWSRTRLKQSLIYRLFNVPKKPTMTRVAAGQEIVHVVYTPPKGDKAANHHDTTTTVCSSGSRMNKDNSSHHSKYVLRFVGSSHPARLLQMHHYFEDVLDIPAGSDARLALIVACCSHGDMFTAERLFRDFRSQASEEIYGAMIRGWVSRTDKRLEVQGVRTEDQWQMGTRRSARINSAMELFYEMQQRGIVPSFETYHTLTVGLATFKNDLEAAELMLQHMILRKGKPYVQVLHVLLREYGRRGDYEAMQRILGLYHEYGLPLKPVSATLLLKAVFQLRDSQVQAMIERDDRRSREIAHTTTGAEKDAMSSSSSSNNSSSGTSHEASTTPLDFRRRQIANICGLLSKEGRMDPFVVSTLIYGYGHLAGAQQDLDQLVRSLLSSKTPMTTVLWTSIVMAHIGQRRLRRAEATLGKALKWYKDQVLQLLSQEPLLAKGDEIKNAATVASTTATTTTKPLRKNTKLGWKSEVAAIRRSILPIPRGVFHAVMVGMVESNDVFGMERIAAKMMDLSEFCAQHEDIVRRLAAYGKDRTAWQGQRQQEADEYTANILLLGYLVGKEIDKAKKVAYQIEQHPSWETRRGHAGIEALRQHVFQQARKSEMQLMREAGGREDAMSGDRTRSDDGVDADEKSHIEEVMAAEGVDELDDDVEIDVQALTQQLRSTIEKERQMIGEESKLRM
ncbi:hypothetical protein BGZ73_009005 [Actinomortierella ambigua]|nr:hypothetical protein BGZ73_009005 [Actinomortierella ambigua]